MAIKYLFAFVENELLSYLAITPYKWNSKKVRILSTSPPQMPLLLTF